MIGEYPYLFHAHDINARHVLYLLVPGPAFSLVCQLEYYDSYFFVLT